MVRQEVLRCFLSAVLQREIFQKAFNSMFFGLLTAMKAWKWFDWFFHTRVEPRYTIDNVVSQGNNLENFAAVLWLKRSKSIFILIFQDVVS